jgi:HNH endonuclease
MPHIAESRPGAVSGACYIASVAAERTKVPPALKKQLVRQAGGKCANPGCSAYRTHIHHIQRWSGYETHDGEHMIAVCPTCHDAIHDGPLVIDDETVRRWKSIERTETKRDHVYVEPASEPKLLLGTLAFMGENEGLTVFKLAASSELSFRLADGDIMLLNLSVSSMAGREIVRVVEGHVRHAAEEPVRYERVQGHVRLTAPLTSEFMPSWAVKQLRRQEPRYASDGRLTLLDLEVLEPGLVRVQGLWRKDYRNLIAVTPSQLSFLQPGRLLPISLVGEGVDSVLHYVGPFTSAAIGFG